MLRGRDVELARCTSVLDRVAARTGGGAIVVEGEAGMGKTTFVAAAVEHAASRGFAVLQGRGHALGAGVAYGPVAAALGRYLHGLAGDDRSRLTAGLASLARLVEGIGEPPPPTDPDLERSRLYQSVALLLGRVGAERPVLVCIDDLHWADAASVELLEYLIDELASEQLAVVAAFRPSDVASRPDVRHLVGTLQRLPTAARLEIGPLLGADLAALVVDRLGGPPSSALLEQLRERTGGVALAVDAVLRGLGDAGALADGPEGWMATTEVAVPEYVVELFGDRLGVLPAGSRDVVAAIAIADEPLDAPVLREVLGIDDVAVDAAADRAVAAGLARAVAPAAWDVGHPLVAEAARALLGETERRRLHLAFATVLAAQGEGVLDRRARHVVGAGSLVADGEAANVLGQAGRRAMSRGGWDAAARWLSAAAVRAESAGLPPSEIADLLTAAAAAWERRYELDAAIAAHGQAMELLAPTDAGAAALSGIAAARLNWQLGRSDVDPWTPRALSLAATAPPAARLRVHYEQLGALLRQGRAAEAAPVAAKVRDDLTEADGPVVAAAAFRLVVHEALLGDLPTERIIEAAPTPPPDAPLDLVVNVVGPLLDALITLGRWDEVLQRADDLLAAVGPDVAVSGLSWRGVVARIHAAFATGRWQDASDQLTELTGRSAVVNLSRAFWTGVVRLHAGDADGARTAVGDARAAVTRGVLRPQVSAIGVLLEYIELVDRGTAQASSALMDRAPYHAMNNVLVASMAGEVLAAAGAEPQARKAAADLRTRGGPGSLTSVAASRIDALVAADAAGLARAADGFDALRMPFDAARARLEAAEHGATGIDLVGVRDTLRRLDARPWEARARALLGVGAADPEPSRDPLTPREREIAALVADGLTNGQIAERLAISIRTVTSHLDHAYTKLGIGTRTALVSYVLRVPRLDAPT